MGQKIPPEVAALPAFLRKDLKERCRGDWRRVVVHADGSVVVHNAPVQVAKAVAAGLAKAKPRKRAAKKSPPPREVAVRPEVVASPETPPPPAPAPVRDFKVTYLKPALPPQRRTVARRRTPEPVVPQTPAPASRPEPSARPLSGTVVRHQGAQRQPTPWDHLPDFMDEADWEASDVGRISFGLAALAAKGVPEWFHPRFHPDVLALDGLDIPAARACIQRPERCEVAPETKKKGYPVLRFYKGSVCVVLGFRQAKLPVCIAAYFTGEALKRYQGASGAGGGTGGGGARKEGGLPTTGPRLLRAIRDLGASVALVEGKELAQVTYKGQDLGKVEIGEHVNKAAIETHWQRTQRRVNAINLRGESQ